MVARARLGLPPAIHKQLSRLRSIARILSLTSELLVLFLKHVAHVHLTLAVAYFLLIVATGFVTNGGTWFTLVGIVVAVLKGRALNFLAFYALRIHRS